MSEPFENESEQSPVVPQKPELFITSANMVQLASGLLFLKQGIPATLNLDGFLIPVFLADDFEEGDGEVEVADYELAEGQNFLGLEILSAPESPHVDYCRNKLFLELEDGPDQGGSIVFEFELTVSIVRKGSSKSTVRVEFVVSVEGGPSDEDEDEPEPA